MKKSAFIILECGLPFILVVLFCVGTTQLNNNFHTVIEGELYRSAQISPANMQHIVRTYGIQTIINLRGENKGTAWYDQEVAAAKALAVQHIDFRMSSKRPLLPARVAELVKVMRDSPKPILIHCRAGSDRTGLAAAIYVASIAKLGEVAAEQQLSFYYGHLPFSFLPAYAMDMAFENLEPSFGFSGS